MTIGTVMWNHIIVCACCGQLICRELFIGRIVNLIKKNVKGVKEALYIPRGFTAACSQCWSFLLVKRVPLQFKSNESSRSKPSPKEVKLGYPTAEEW
jgi:hypothetical protein